MQTATPGQIIDRNILSTMATSRSRLQKCKQTAHCSRSICQWTLTAKYKAAVWFLCVKLLHAQGSHQSMQFGGGGRHYFKYCHHNPNLLPPSFCILVLKWKLTDSCPKWRAAQTSHLETAPDFPNSSKGNY